ncbi:MAG TPA: urea ABC transporter permease subunit UrtB [Opitutaceae bacterium]|nr:urea ABC transporter permease subunit UrtB [Opitutaceae bacterium]
MDRFVSFLSRLRLLGCALLLASVSFGATARQTISLAAMTSDSAEKVRLIQSLSGSDDAAVPALLAAWREDSLFIYAPEGGEKIVVQLTGEKDDRDAQPALRVDTGEALKDASGAPLRLVGADLIAVEHDALLRRTMKEVLDLQELSASDPARRIQAVETLGFAQNLEKLPLLLTRATLEQDDKVKLSLREAIALIRLKDPSDEVKISALQELRTLHTMGSIDFLRRALKQAQFEKKTAVATAADLAIDAVEKHKARVNFFGTIFRGVSNGSILLVVALGLAITFGLMKVINMAHGEMIAIGAYTAYVVQNIFGSGLAVSPFGFSVSIPGLHLAGWKWESYFLVALPLSFLAAAVVGIVLERTVIQFLYRRPLESLLATWGVSLLLQQLFRLIFGANNVQVYSPSYLSGNWTINDVIFGWNRVFVICFAVVVVFGTWLILTKTPLGLLIRAVMQNRGMAACMGVRTERVNMLTFGLGSGLAGLAGAFLSQIGNVGPSLGQSYIVDCFMTVVVGGVGNLAGTVISAAGIGLADQSLQQLLLNPVLGKILVLVGIILFLQWRPAGIFVTRSRSLDD